ncbi:MAG: hypothetical protein Q9M28_08425, partial [Mariprofundaceae bacterium]|nr:hypothetical protein [Mariprofundaceae bacterium]
SQLSVDETTIMVCLLSDSRLRSTEFHKVIEHAFSDEILHMVQSLEKRHWTRVIPLRRRCFCSLRTYKDGEYPLCVVR